MIILPILNLEEYSRVQQYAKAVEEMDEVRRALQDVEDVGNVLGECFDLIQSILGLMLKVAEKEDIEVAGAKHFIKLKERGWTNLGQIEVHFK